MPTERSTPEPRRTQADRRRETSEALIAAGRSLFAEHGVAAVSTEEVVAAAGVTRGALYHHFRDKNDLFRAVFERVEQELCAELAAGLAEAPSAIEGLRLGVGWFLDACERPEVRRIGLVEAPAVLGWATWRRIEAEYALGLVVEQLRAAAQEGASLPGPVEVVASLLFSTIIEAALMITQDDDPAAARERVEPALAGLVVRVLGLGN